MNVVSSQVSRYRSIWISDVHLGTRGCQAEMLLDFLKYTESEYLYLVGDIIDGWRMKRNLVLAPGPQRRHSEIVAQGAQRNAADLHSRKSR